MAKTKIEWTWRLIRGVLYQGYTFNAWIGCTKCSPLCKLCYAKSQNEFYKWNKAGWGPGVPRQRTSAEYWRNPIRWNKQAKKLGVRLAVFCCSLADVFDDEVPQAWRDDLIELLTKRPENILKMTPADWPFPNVWPGASVGLQSEMDRTAPILNELFEQRKVTTPIWLSMEPLLEAVKIPPQYYNLFSWIICGGESHQANPQLARPINPAWVKDLQVQCYGYGISFFWKQWGEWCPIEHLRDEQAKGICKAGLVKCHTFEDGQKTYLVTKRIAGNHFEDKVIQQQPKRNYIIDIDRLSIT